mmetsp:Transcript_29711/g.47337  ORF Transcript_29711/g.47337 Transcript_29711/m.47337 type:complete len:403 (+) Transcript_29711:23-1231(+)
MTAMNLVLTLPFAIDNEQDDASTASTVSPQSPISSPVATDSFTMVFLDFDDTIIPTTLHQFFRKDLHIDLLSLLKRTEIYELQTAIIETIEQIKNDFAENNEHVHFAVISNGDQKWLELMLKGSNNRQSQKRVRSSIALLNDYFVDNNISVLSAPRETYLALKSQHGEKAEAMFRGISNAEDRWMWKYTAFANVISAYNGTCRRVISIGDGFDEQRAAHHYGQLHHCDALHFSFLGAPTVSQLIQQWNYIQSQRGLFRVDACDLEKIRKAAPMGHVLRKVDARFFVDELPKNDGFECDNTVHCTGNMHQLPAIRAYFSLWMDAAEATRAKTNDQKKYENAMDTVCRSIHQRMFRQTKESETSRNFRLILMKAICRNKQFNAAFNAYIHKLKKVAMLQQQSVQ